MNPKDRADQLPNVHRAADTSHITDEVARGKKWEPKDVRIEPTVHELDEREESARFGG